MRAVSFISRLGLSVGLVLGIGSVAMAASSSNFAKYPGTTFAYGIAPADMSPSAYTIKYYVSSGVYIEGDTTDYGCFNAGVHLPPGAIMKQLVVSYSSSIYADPMVDLNRRRLGARGYNTLVHATIPDNDGTLKLVTYNIPQKFSSVDNNRYLYRFIFCLGYADYFYGARVTYVQ